jgi:formylmethanofuran:tetrahydromethanopterin formyltransferase
MQQFKTDDQLNQLVSEDEHTYCFDSIHNRLQKDNAPHTVNNLCQILHDGNTQDILHNPIFVPVSVPVPVPEKSYFI